MLASFCAILVALAATSFAHPTQLLSRSESHTVQFTNKCSSGNPVFLYQNNATPQGSTTIDGPLLGGVAWLDGYDKADCELSGVNCGIVEFTLVNPGSSNGNTQNAADFSLQSEGNHQFTYDMNFAFTGSCTAAAPGRCRGDSATACPGGFIGSNTMDGAPVQCEADNTGIHITFCN
ncbi:MAG: hypothetical protein TREMPRED_002555 [Tremellales sp. Tagirdzhanova-0007]|nr:MAG: hypothetical protein TREMPRED_002555 [Tremellales sp. Tagirdzhanova-0007]